MKPVSQIQIDQFLTAKTIAIAGASRKEKSFSAEVAKHLSNLQYKLWLINPNFEPNDTENGRVQSVAGLPDEVKHLLVLTPAAETESIVKQAVAKGINQIWIQQQSETAAAIDFALQNNVNLIHHHCIFMFTKPTGIHKFHYTIKRIFGSLPK